MKVLVGLVVAAVVLAGLATVGRAADAAEPNAIVDKAIKALGGAEAVGKVKAFSTTSTGTVTLNGTAHPITLKSLIGGPGHSRSEFEGEFDGNTVRGVTVLAGDRAWRRIGEEGRELDKEAVANEKLNAYLGLVSVTVLPLKDAKAKLEAIPDERVADKPAAGLKVTPPDGKEFRMYFDKESGLPVRLVAKVLDFEGNEFTQETTLGEYKPMGGIQKATRVTSTRDGEKFIDVKVSEFQCVEKVDAKAFEEPK